MAATELRRAAVALLAATAVAACSATVAPRAPAPLPTGTAPSVRRVLDVLEARDKALARFRGQARLEYRSPEQGFRSTQVVAVKSPSSARIDVMNPFGVSYSVATDGKKLTAFDRRKSVYYQGSAEAGNFRRFTGIPLGANELASVLRGLPPALGDSRWADVRPTDGGWLLSRRLGTGGTLEFVVEAATLVPLRVRIYGDRSRHEVEVRYSDHRDVAGVTVPHLIEVDFKDGSHLEMEYKSVQRDVALGDDAFRVDRPARARFVDMDREGAVGIEVPSPSAAEGAGGS